MQSIHVRYSLTEFIANLYDKKYGVKIMHTTMKSYILGIQRRFDQKYGCDLKSFSGKIFSCSNSGFKFLLDNNAWRLQEKSNRTKHHNVLSIKGLLLLFNLPVSFS